MQGLPSSLRRSGACIKCRRNVLEVSAVASAEPSTVKIITRGRHVEVTESLKKYVVRFQHPPFYRNACNTISKAPDGTSGCS